ncbi:hypothetical protein [Kitasatospora cathayae]|uniref:Uncharacterized protein n=1 Tax=Kitasatospora cathayae TaxID=3004092 RepID=A0ABY7QCM2_9ACTN|nr:hypothetical protein [Kitasatospora sp. HUAS 3-15]WBP90425.1 hypothetical protein O1G21_34240 [Kitasatospora sp. HUAS 3-15]
MADLRWDDHAAWLLDPVRDGWLPDGCVADTTTADWQAVLDLVVEQGWALTFVVGCFEVPLPRAEEVLSWPAGSARPVLSVRPGPEVGAVFRFRSAERIDFDVDVDRLRGQEGLDVLCEFLAAVGRRLGRSVPTYAGSGDTPFLQYDRETDRVLVR